MKVVNTEKSELSARLDKLDEATKKLEIVIKKLNEGVLTPREERFVDEAAKYIREFILCEGVSNDRRTKKNRRRIV